MVCACPFAPWTHSKGTDSTPSFGVSVGRHSYYHCFACQRKGPLPMLVTSLCMLKGKDNVEAREFVMEHEDLSLEPFENLDPGPEPLSILAPGMISRFEPATEALEICKKRGITQQTIDTLELRWDTREKRLVFPIWNEKGYLVGFRGRAVGDEKLRYREYSELQAKRQSLKAHGIWYGMDRVPEERYQKVILVEGEMDAVSLLQALAQRKGVWAAMGAALSAAQIKTIQALKNPVLIFFDDDEAGHIAKQSLLKKLSKVKTGVFEITDYRGRKDPDEIVKAGQLRKALESIKQVA